MSLNTIEVIIPNVPSLPTRSCVRLYPVEFFKTFAPVQIISPVGKTTCKFRTKSFVTPYLRAFGPPAFSAKLPPKKQLP